MEALSETLQKGTEQQCEYRMQQKDGGWIHLQTETIPVLDANGRVESAVLLAADVTENRKLDEALALASTKATATGLVEAMARDFDQILTNVFGNLTIALETSTARTTPSPCASTRWSARCSARATWSSACSPSRRRIPRRRCAWRWSRPWRRRSPTWCAAP